MNPAHAMPHGTAPSRSSIAAHPWFPKLIGLWCAALFGLCSLALAPEMLEQIVTTLGIDQVVAAAAPPLGQTARLLLALGLSGVGEIVGLVIGRRLAAHGNKRHSPSEGKSTDRHAADPGDVPSLRHRDRHPDAPARKPLSANHDLRDDAVAGLALSGSTFGSPHLASDADQEPGPICEVPPKSRGTFWQSAETIESGNQQTVEAELAKPLDTAQAVPLDAFESGQSEVPSEGHPEAHCAQAPATVAEHFASSFAPPPAASAPIAAASLDQLGVVQLSERLALALQARREHSAQASVASLPIDAPTEAGAVAGPEILAHRAPKPDFQYAAVAENAEAIRADLSIDAETDEDEPFSDDTLEVGYSSLLAMGSGLQRPQAVPLEQPLEGAIEADNRSNREETDRALRAALDSLQRISGAR